MVIGTLQELESLLPEAIEVDEELVRIIANCIEEITLFNKEIWPASTKKDLGEYVFATNVILKKYTDQCQEIRLEVLQKKVIKKK
ncbi:hypothetical protein EBB07_31410 [Paenibacillaceae bacterium]|nr:hypothetical protein EBB07_31410 [Paenibacillaceae bacterium]